MCRLYDKITKIRDERKLKKSRERVQDEFQIAERDGEIWITFDGCYILPCSMLNMQPVEALLKIRELHI